MNKKRIAIISAISVLAIMVVTFAVYSGFFISKTVSSDALWESLSTKSVKGATEYEAYGFLSYNEQLQGESIAVNEEKTIFVPKNGTAGVSDEICIAKWNYFLSPLFKRWQVMDYVISKKSEQPIGVYLISDDETKLQTMIFFSENSERVNKVISYVMVNDVEKKSEDDVNPYYPVLSYVHNLGVAKDATTVFVKAEFYTEDGNLFYTYKNP